MADETDAPERLLPDPTRVADTTEFAAVRRAPVMLGRAGPAGELPRTNPHTTSVPRKPPWLHRGCWPRATPGSTTPPLAAVRGRLTRT